MPGRRRYFLLFVLTLFLTACATVQTTYFHLSYQALEDINNPALLPYDGESEHWIVEDMNEGVAHMYSIGYAMIGYSQFVSPLIPGLAPGYAEKYAKIRKAEYAVLQEPTPGESNLSGYLVTYWAKYKLNTFGFGASYQDLPRDLLDRLGDKYNVVMITQTFKDSPAMNAGFLADDVILAVDGIRVLDTDGFSQTLTENAGRAITISVSRQGELLDIPVTLAIPEQVGGSWAYHNAPWKRTAPTDWSSLSAANTVARVQQQQLMQAQREAAYERGRLEAERRAQSYSYSSNVSVSSSASDSRRGSQRSVSNARRSSAEYQEFQQAYSNTQVKQWLVEDAEWNSEDWTVSAPSTYNNLFQYPAFVAD